jgi:hypothetical protein
MLGLMKLFAIPRVKISANPFGDVISAKIFSLALLFWALSIF